jgi:hypothetical protein
MEQCWMRNIAVGPLASFNHWKELGRHVKRGGKAIALWIPITIKRENATDEEKADDSQEERGQYAVRFVIRRNWFVVSQTDGKEFTPPNPYLMAKRV